MNVEIGAEAALFPEKEYISGIFVAVYQLIDDPCTVQCETYLASEDDQIKSNLLLLYDRVFGLCPCIII
jgi:hypothetical protein